VNLTVGNKVVYPHQGPCRIDEVVDRVVDGRPMSFYHLAVLDDRGGKLLVPTDKVDTLGIRRLLERSEIPKLFGHPKKAAAPATNWKQRAIEHSKLLTSGSPFDLAAVVVSLTELNDTKALSPREQETLYRARKLLICEISEVMGETRSAAEAYIDQALKARRKQCSDRSAGSKFGASRGASE
jgi:RNA polymerase-interacting CarD/CdnL/TRCF family regulator